MKISALVPMKGHSERVPNKNIRLINGKPLFSYILEALRQVDAVEQIIINTDSNKIAEQALKLFPEIKIHERPKEICGDFVSMNTIIEHDLNHSEHTYYMQTHSTNPLVKPHTISKAIEHFSQSIKEGYDSLFSVTLLQTRLYWKDGQPINHNPMELLRTQDLPPVFEENSCIYLFSKESFFKTGKRIGNHPVMFEMDSFEAVDIDNEIDFYIAEQMIKYQGL